MTAARRWPARADAPEGGYPSLFRQKRTPRNGHGLCERRVVLEFLDFFWSMDARGGNDLLNSFLNATKE